MNRHCRIGKVTRKSDGASITVLRPKDDGSAADTLTKLQDHVNTLSKLYKDDAAGFAVVVWDRAGRTNRGFLNQRSSPFGSATARLVVAAALEADTIEGVVVDTFNR